MKFSHSIQFNAVPDWSSNYISYSNLKKLIYQLEKDKHHGRVITDDADPESSPLLAGGDALEDADKVFTRALDHDLEKICSFYRNKETELFGEVEALLKDEEEFELDQGDSEAGAETGIRKPSTWQRARQQSIFRSFQFPPKRRRRSTMGSGKGGRGFAIPEEGEGASSDDDDTNEHSGLTKNKSQDGRSKSRNLATDMATGNANSDEWQRSSQELRRRPSTMFNDFGDDALQALYDEGITLKKRTVNLYVSVCELRSFVQLNETGFGKVLKKYDKTLDRKLKSSYVNSKVKPAYPFLQSTMDTLLDNLTKIEQAYAGIVTKGDVETARKELRLHLREHVVWERNTVWREMIGIERKAQAANLGIRNTMLGSEDPKKARLQGDDDTGATKEVDTPVGKYRCPRFLLSGTFWTLIASIIVFIVLLLVPIMEKQEQQNCLALVVFVSLLWATEVSHRDEKHVVEARLTFTVGHSPIRDLLARAFPGCHT